MGSIESGIGRQLGIQEQGISKHRRRATDEAGRWWSNDGNRTDADVSETHTSSHLLGKGSEKRINQAIKDLFLR